MNETFFFLFQYLKKININIDESDFIFQIQSHPEYPTLLSICDTLDFYNIENRAIHLDFTDFEFLPNIYIASLNEVNNKQDLYLVEKKENKYFITKDRKTFEISSLDLEKRWNNIVILIEKPEFEIKELNTNKIQLVLPFLSLIIFLILVYQSRTNLLSKLFFCFPIFGFFLSFAALKDLFGTKITFINNFCNITSTSSCNSIITSKKWKIFSYVNFSDLAIVFFSSQFFGFLTFLIANNSSSYFVIQSFLLLSSLPIILLSIYYQKFVEKKWCPICLLIILLILIEICYLLVLLPLNYDLSFRDLYIFALVFLMVLSIWILFKRILINQKDLRENQLKSNRFIRNYEIFRNTLLSSEKSQILSSPIILGNPIAKTKIQIITSPFCKYCKDSNEMLERILNKKSKDIQVQLIFKTDLTKVNEEQKSFLRNLIGIYNQKGEVFFREALNFWFEEKNISKWLQKFEIFDLNFIEIDLLYNFQNNFCTSQGYNYTPAIFINSFEYPKLYERENLEFFINDLIEDEKINS